MAKLAINKAWAENSTNKINMDDETFSRGILFESAVESKIPNQAVYIATRAIKEQQEFGATLYIEGKTYPQGSIVLVMINIGNFVSQRMYMKIGAETNDSFPLETKEIYQELGLTKIYKLKPTNTSEWQEITGYSSADLIADYQQDREYQHGETCYIWIDIATQEIFLQKPQDLGVRYRKVLISSSINNNDKIPSRESLERVWFLEDGFEVGQGKIDLALRIKDDRTLTQIHQLGYILINDENIDRTYNFSEYPRIEYIFKRLDLANFENFSIFQKLDSYQFKVRDDIRGHFMRIWSNKRTDIDLQRVFYSLQTPGLPNLTGKFEQRFYDPYHDGVFGTWVRPNAGFRYNGPLDITPRGITFNASLGNNIYKDNHNDVTPYNFNINLLCKV